MSFVYISGPITLGGKASYREQLAFVRNAEECAYYLMKHGIPFFLPHNNTYLWGYKFPDLKHEDYMKNDLAILKHAKAILLLERWTESPGCQEEVKFAYKKGLPQFHQNNIEQLINFYHRI